MPKVNPLTLEKWTPADDETLQSVMAGKLPDVFRGQELAVKRVTNKLKNRQQGWGQFRLCKLRRITTGATGL